MLAAGVIRHRLEFAAPGRVRVVEEAAPEPAAGQVLVRTTSSAISPGTEMLIYRGRWPADTDLDATITALPGQLSYPVTYGYAAVGRVDGIGTDVDAAWRGRRVFAFAPHQSIFCAEPETLHPIPEDIDDDTALFVPAMETAVTLLLDGRPLLGERVVVVGQGVIGLLTTALLARFPLAGLVTVERCANRRAVSLELGADRCFTPADPDLERTLGCVPGGGGEADLIYELCGDPSGLNEALRFIRFSGRVVLGSWYGNKRADLDLGSFFHRGRVQLISSQVSTIAPELTGRWHGPRRLELVWEMLRRVQPATLISQRFSIHDAPAAYELIDSRPDESIQPIFAYRPSGGR